MAWYISATENNYQFFNCIISTEPTKVQDISKLFGMPADDVLAAAKADGTVKITQDGDEMILGETKKDKRKRDK